MSADTVTAALAEGLGRLAEYGALPARERNYPSVMWANLLADALTRLAFAYDPHVIARAHEDGQDVMAHELGTMALDMRRDGVSDSDVLTALMETIAARMAVGLPQEEWFT